jgi:putative PIN family toxin of toxin-antitoxin system
MTVVIDTNVMNGMFVARHPHAVLRHAWYAGAFKWALSTDILQEYEEVLGRMRGPAKAEEILSLVMNLGTRLGTVQEISPAFFFRTISADRDDDKFADCAIAARADYIITSDRHFAPLIGSGFKPQPIEPEDFIARFLPSSAPP